MFVKIATSLALTVGLSLPSIASETRTVNSQLVCAEWGTIDATLTEHGEIPFARMSADRHIGRSGVIQNIVVIFVNPKTKTFTVVEQFKEDLYCVLSIGSEFGPIPEQNDKPL